MKTIVVFAVTTIFSATFLLSVGVPIFVAWARLHKLNLKKKKEIRLLFIAIVVLSFLYALALMQKTSALTTFIMVLLITLTIELLLVSILIITDKNGKFVKKMAATSLGFNTLWCLVWAGFTGAQYREDKKKAIYDEYKKKKSEQDDAMIVTSQ